MSAAETAVFSPSAAWTAAAEPDFVAAANERLAGADIPTILRWAAERFPGRVAMTTAFGYSGMVLLHHAVQHMPEMKVYFVDTGFHFPETLEFAERIRREWGLNVETLRPVLTRAELEDRLGAEPWKTDANACCEYCKVAPLFECLRHCDAWVSAIRRDQTGKRNGIRIVEITSSSMLKLSPMAQWTSQEAWQYIRRHKLPYHPLHDRGYPSIGCRPCSAPVPEGGHERQGRWPFSNKVECGLHFPDDDEQVRRSGRGSGAGAQIAPLIPKLPAVEYTERFP